MFSPVEQSTPPGATRPKLSHADKIDAGVSGSDALLFLFAELLQRQEVHLFGGRPESGRSHEYLGDAYKQ
jgi:hypothetical protein